MTAAPPLNDAAGAAAVLSIEDACTVYESQALKQRLLQALDGAAGLQLDLSGVSEIDGAGVQLLLAARHEAQRRGLSCALLRPSPAVQEALALVDPQGRLGLCPMPADGSAP